ncbi:hypothetical protein Psi01_83850 [Planobispora siamensis]|uniref:Uncharacterized protein n=1 Tax=Planobispora siamensis TaxID=936338 RepID=A0A8J3SQQ7_9ACTN|nr:hypothetical protein Psi01_83850 [Planobispora siamensis]
MVRVADLAEFAEEASAIPLPPIRRSGVYIRKGLASQQSPLDRNFPEPSQADGFSESETQSVPQAEMQVEAAQAIPPLIQIEELRVDVDGLVPTMTVSGTIFKLFAGRLTWIARVIRNPVTQTYDGTITYRDGDSSLLPQTRVSVRLLGVLPTGRVAQARFSGGGMPSVTRTYVYRDSHFRTVGIEFDYASDASLVTSYALHSHSNKPVDLPNITLTIESAYSRQGIRMTNTGDGNNEIPIDEAMSDALWSDLEMHDAMQKHWSKWADAPQWQVWTLFAGRHEMGPGLGGIMFDDIGTAQRQGCAVFMNSFISDPPPGDLNAPAAIRRMQFWTALHEIGHTFNLAHSWQKSLGTPWIPALANEPEARSLMNYPFRVAGGPQAFFSDFYYLLSEEELVFLRHAPSRFVQHGNAPWFDHHGFEQARARSEGALRLSLRVNRDNARYEMLEPVTAELKLKNVSTLPVVVDWNILRSDQLGVVVLREGREARQWVPYAQTCTAPQPHVLQPGESLYAPIFLSAGQTGWLIDEPGLYLAYAAVQTENGGALSAPLSLRIDRPASREHERMADNVLTDLMGRVLAFGGSRHLTGEMDLLNRLIEEQPDRAVTRVAATCLARVAAVPGRRLEGEGAERRFIATTPQPEVAEQMLTVAYDDMNAAAETLGHIRLTQEVTRVARALVRQGDDQHGSRLTTDLANTLEQRAVLGSVVATVRNTVEEAKKDRKESPR